RDVAPDLAVDPVSDGAPTRLRIRGQESVEALHAGRALEEHEEREERDRHGADDEVEDALRDRDRGAREPEELPRAAVLDVLLELLDRVVLRLEEAEPPPSLHQVVDITGNGVDEVVDVVDEGGDERVADTCDGD